MTDRITKNDVNRMFQRATDAAKAIGLDPQRWELIHGRSSVGVSWSLLTGRGGSSDIPIGFESFGGYGVIGKTAREAYLSLNALRAAWEGVARQRERDEASENQKLLDLIEERGSNLKEHGF